MNSDFMVVLEYLEHERGIDRETLIELIEESLAAAAKKGALASRNVRVKIDRQTGEIEAWVTLVVVDLVNDPHGEISLAKAKKRYPDVQIGDEIEWKETAEDLGRIAAQTAKQAIAHRLRQAEKQNICEDFASQLNQLITGVVRRVERGDVYIDFQRAEGVLRHGERIPGENYMPGEHITALLTEINAESAGPSLVVSRAHPNLVRCLFEREVAEIAEKIVEVKAVSREPGYRTKIAVFSPDNRIDPVGACVGLRGTRVKTVVRELGGEKVDIINWEPEIKKFVANALQPAKLVSVTVDEAAHTIRVSAAEDQLSLAIGRKGQNARLAAKLTGWKIDISRQEETKKQEFEDKLRHAVEVLAKLPSVGSELAPALVQHGFLSLEGILAAEESDIAALEDVGPERAKTIIAEAREKLGY